MTLPLTTTTVTLASRSSSDDAYDAAVWTTQATGLPAHIGPVGSDGRQVGDGAEAHDATLLLNDGVSVARGWRVTDDLTAEVWEVAHVNERTGLGLGHVRCGLRRVSGRVSVSG